MYRKILVNSIGRKFQFILLSLLFSLTAVYSQEGYKNFEVAVYTRSYEVRQMANLERLDSIWTIIEQQVHVDKIYLETHRDLVMVQEDTLEMVKEFFEKRGIKTAGGITYTISERNRFQTFCYSNPKDRKKVKEIMEYTAKHFDEVILDDFFFTNCKCHLCIEAKGEESWTNFRLRLMEEASRDLILGPAKKVNPHVKVIIKYPNWYGHFQGLGFNLEVQPSMFDGIYTGTETRDAFLSAQHLQAYHSYSIFRYFENLKPGGNFGGWVDTGGTRYLDRYGEQLWLTLFAKAPEITLFDFRQMMRPLSGYTDAPWQDKDPSLNVEEMKKPVKGIQPTTIARTAGYVFGKVDPLLAELGNPMGIKCYRPYHAVGEDFLPSFLGMAGLPMEIVPEFPAEEKMILLTESASFDRDIVPKIKQQLLDGKSVTITSGLLKKLQDKGIADIAELRCTGDKSLVSEYVIGWNRLKEEEEILIPQIKYLTNDSWEVVSAIDGPNGWPLLHEAGYAGGSLFVLTIPDNYADMSKLPEAVLNRIRAHLMQALSVQLEAPGNVCIMLYDNHTFIVESFRDEPVSIKLVADIETTSLTDLEDSSQVEGEEQPAYGGWGQAMIQAGKNYSIELPPHAFRAFRLNF